MITEAEARQILAGERAEALCAAVSQSWKDHLALRQDWTPRTRANVLSDFMIRNADSCFARLDGVTRILHNEMVMFVVDDALVLRLKKHDRRDYATANYPTRAQMQIDRDGQLAQMPSREVVTVGYTLDAAEAGIEQIVAARHIAQELEWVIDLRDLAAGVVAPTTPVLPGLPESLTALPGIARRVKEGDGEGS